MQIAGTGALVTGGASGLGAATVRRLADAGAQVVIADLNAQAGEALAAELGEKARFVATDVTSDDSMRAAVAAAAALGNGLRIVVNCAVRTWSSQLKPRAAYWRNSTSYGGSA